MAWCIHIQVSIHQKLFKKITMVQTYQMIYWLFLAELRNAQFKEGELANLSNSAEGRVLLALAMKHIMNTYRLHQFW